MKYLCMVIVDEKKLNAMSASERRKLDDESLAYDETLRKSGHLLAAQALQGVETATTIRASGGRISVTDGPFTETNEQIGGFVLIEARDLDEAIQLASKIPPMRLGCVEVRPIMELTPGTETAG
ncbi:MAG TPA: YciI family protein [Silvibacterium sp.]|nr:YciI family protein [Silvibacterium sp.]